MNTAAPTSNTVLRASGSLKTNLQTVTVPAGVGAYSVVGNPYPSSIDLRKISTGGSVSGVNYVVWDPALTGSSGVGAYQYFTRSGGPGTDYLVFPGNSAAGGGSYGAPFSVNNNIQSGQAFLVQNAGAGSVRSMKMQRSLLLQAQCSGQLHQPIQPSLDISAPYCSTKMEQIHCSWLMVL